MKGFLRDRAVLSQCMFSGVLKSFPIFEWMNSAMHYNQILEKNSKGTTIAQTMKILNVVMIDFSTSNTLSLPYDTSAIVSFQHFNLCVEATGERVIFSHSCRTA